MKFCFLASNYDFAFLPDFYKSLLQILCAVNTFVFKLVLYVY